MRFALLALAMSASFGTAAETPPATNSDAANAIAAVAAKATITNTVWTYQDLVAHLRDPIVADGRTKNPDHIQAIYCGSRESRVAKMLVAGDIDAAGIPVTILASDDLVSNPMTGRQLAGAKLFSIYGGAPGSIVFVDSEGIPIPMANLPHLLHTNDKRIIEAHFSYFSGAYHKRMSFGDYVNAVGAAAAIQAAQKRMDQGFLGQVLVPATPIISGTTADGRSWNPWENPGVVHVVTADPTGRAFRAQLANVLAGAPQVNAKVVVVLPTGTDITSFASSLAKPVTFVFASISDILRMGPTPRLIVTTGIPPAGTGQGCEIWGYLPFELLAMQLGLEVKATSIPDKDMPVGETDQGTMPSVRQAPHPADPTGRDAR